MNNYLRPQQKTLSRSVELKGVALHSGLSVNVKILPAPSDHGIIFQRTDLSSSQKIKATPKNVLQTELCTMIGTKDNSIATIEHLMAALSALDIDNAFIEVDGPEIPILDGSSKPFLNALKGAETHYLDKKKTIYVLKKELSIKIGDKYLRAKPYFGQKFLCSIDFDYNSIGYQKIVYFHSLEAFEKISKARTFCHLNDVEKLKSNGLALGGSLDNALVVSNDSVVNQSGLRCQNEFVKHKLLDMIGDFWLLNKPLFCEIESSKSGHNLHCNFVNKLLDNFDEYLDEIPIDSDPIHYLPRYGYQSNLIEAATSSGYFSLSLRSGQA